jgi:hypothetical protein
MWKGLAFNCRPLSGDDAVTRRWRIGLLTFLFDSDFQDSRLSNAIGAF